MSWDESDTDLKGEWDKSIYRRQQLDLKLRAEREFQNCINALKMEQVIEMTDVTVDGKTVRIPTTKFVLPKNFAGDDMDADYRIEQKGKLIINNDTRLGTLKVD